MQYKAKTIRTFIGAKNFDESRQFYSELGFKEVVLSDKMSLFKINEDLGFYLQRYYVKKWGPQFQWYFLKSMMLKSVGKKLPVMGWIKNINMSGLPRSSNLIGGVSVLCMIPLAYYGTFVNLIKSCHKMFLKVKLF